MKKLLVLVLCMTALVACNQKNSKAEDLRLAQQSDSLNRIIAQKDNEINDMMSTMNDIEEGFRASSAAENRVSVARKGEGAARTCSSSSRPCSRTASSSASCVTSCARVQ